MRNKFVQKSARAERRSTTTATASAKVLDQLNSVGARLVSRPDAPSSARVERHSITIVNASAKILEHLNANGVMRSKFVLTNALSAEKHSTKTATASAPKVRIGAMRSKRVPLSARVARNLTTTATASVPKARTGVLSMKGASPSAQEQKNSVAFPRLTAVANAYARRNSRFGAPPTKIAYLATVCRVAFFQ